MYHQGPGGPSGANRAQLRQQAWGGQQHMKQQQQQQYEAQAAEHQAGGSLPFQPQQMAWQQAGLRTSAYGAAPAPVPPNAQPGHPISSADFPALLQQQQQRQHASGAQQQQQDLAAAMAAASISGGSGGGSSMLKVHAAEFVPGIAAGQGSAEISDLKPSAAEFVPGGGGRGASGSSAGVYGSSQDGQAAAPAGYKQAYAQAGEEPLEGEVEGMREHGGYLQGEGGRDLHEEEEEEGFFWTYGAASFPGPPKVRSMSVPDGLWAELQRQTLDMMRQLPPSDERLKEIPSRFYAIYPLDDANKRRGTSGSFGHPSTTYKVISNTDGLPYALRRFEGVRTTANIMQETLEMWHGVSAHPGLVQLKEAFMYQGCAFFVEDYHPRAETLAQRYLERPGNLLPEGLLWSIGCQLLSAVRAVHMADARMACRHISPEHVLLLPGGRVRINWAGVHNALEYEALSTLPAAAAAGRDADIKALACTVISIACRARVAPGAPNLPGSLSFIKANYSPELWRFLYELSLRGVPLDQALVMAAPHMADCLDASHHECDVLHSHLHGEYDNGRLLRLLLKLGAVNERPDTQRGVSGGGWSETGDRYVLKLFRDYCFHQVDETGAAHLDLGHMLQCLNKLDVGDPERILLTSRDQRNILVASYEDIKRCLEEAFNELCATGNAQMPPGIAMMLAPGAVMYPPGPV